TIDRAYFDLTGGLDRWLYRLVRKHGGRQRDGWRFDFHHLHQKSGALSPFKRFAFELRDIIRRQPLPGYTLFLETEVGGRKLLAFEPAPGCGKPVNALVLSGTRTVVPSGTGVSCYQEPKQGVTYGSKSGNRSLNLESNEESSLTVSVGVKHAPSATRDHLANDPGRSQQAAYEPSRSVRLPWIPGIKPEDTP
ncbi:MAG: replication initiator protein A, partial [Jhaorihella sp.]